MKKIDDSLWLIEKRKVSELIKNDRNPRIINKETLKGVRESLKRNGYIDKIVINNKNKILSGHARQIILSEQDPEMEIDVIVAQRDLTPEEEDNVLLGMNTQGGKWNMDDLGLKFDPLTLEAFDIEFNQIEPEKEVEEDTPPEVDDQNPPKTKLGDVWILGEHRVMCGDSTSVTDVEKLMGGQKADMVFTDPPYNVNVTSRSKKNGNNIIKNDNMSEEDFDIFIYNCFLILSKFSKDSSPFYIWHNHHCQVLFEKNLIKNDFIIKSQIIWTKDIPSYTPILYRQQHEICFYCSKKNQDIKTEIGKDSTIWNVPSIQSANSSDEYGKKWFSGGSKNLNLHVTQKPVLLPSKALKNSTIVGDLVLDLFGGSGSTLIACEQLNRKCFMMELDPKYVDVIVKRWQNLTGKTAYLESTNQPFGE